MCKVLFVFLQHPPAWQLSSDATKLIGHMVLCKSADGLPPGEQGGILGKGTLGKTTTFFCNHFACIYDCWLLLVDFPLEDFTPSHFVMQLILSVLCVEMVKSGQIRPHNQSVITRPFGNYL